VGLPEGPSDLPESRDFIDESIGDNNADDEFLNRRADRARSKQRGKQKNPFYTQIEEEDNEEEEGF